MKAKLPFSIALRFALPRKWGVSRLFAVLPSAFSFVLLAVAGMGYLFDRRDYIARACFDQAQEQGYVAFAGNGNYAPGNTMDEKELAAFQETGIALVFEADAGVLGWTHFVEGGVPASLLQLGGMVGSLGLAGGAEDYAAIGFSLIAGKYPSAADEVAIEKFILKRFVRAAMSMPPSSSFGRKVRAAVLNLTELWRRGNVSPFLPMRISSGRDWGTATPRRTAARAFIPSSALWIRMPRKTRSTI